MRLMVLSGTAILAWLVVAGSGQAWAQRSSRPSGVSNRATLNTGSEFGYNYELEKLRGQTRARRAPTLASVSRYARGLTERSLSIPQNRNRRTKPFEGLQKSPTLSPYLSLLNADTGSGLPNYFAYTRPQLQQQRTNRRQQQQVQGLRQQVRAIDQQMVNPAGSAGLRPTGHQTVYMNLSHFYPVGR